MGRSGIRLRHVVGSLALVGSLLLLAGCEPLRNAPPGGGETVTQTFRYGPFTLGPGEEMQGSPSSGMPRPVRRLRPQERQVRRRRRERHAGQRARRPPAPHRHDDLRPRGPALSGAARAVHRLRAWSARRSTSGGPYTYLVGANDQWGSIYHLMNETPAGTPAKTVYIQYTLDYQPGANATNSRPVDAYFQDITGCGDSTYDVPGNGGPGSVHTRSRSWPAPRDGHRRLHRWPPARGRHRHHAQGQHDRTRRSAPAPRPTTRTRGTSRRSTRACCTTR